MTEKTYTGKPCVLHGETLRYKTNGRCLSCLKEAKRSRRAEHGDEVRRAERELYARTKTNLESWIGRPLKNAKARAKKLDIPFDLDHEYLLSIWTGKCAVFGTELFISQTENINDQATLDRIVPSLGYVRGNVAFLSNLANRIKNDATAEQITQVAEWLSLVGTPKHPRTM